MHICHCIMYSVYFKPTCLPLFDSKKSGLNRFETGGSTITKLPKKTQSFSHSVAGIDETTNGNLIKITNMGTVSVPVPFPVSHGNNASEEWF